MGDKEKQNCVICHKDITNELPKIDVYGNHYCKDCYVEKCKYELMNMRDTILINKELLKSQLQYLEEQTQKLTQKETAEKYNDKLVAIIQHLFDIGQIDFKAKIEFLKENEKILKQFGVEIKE